MQVGETFFFENIEYSIKKIEKDKSELDERFPNGRVDASNFETKVVDGIEERRIRKGRPKAFTIEQVSEALGEDFTDTIKTATVESDIPKEEFETVKESWDVVRKSTVSPEDREKLINMISDDSTTSDW